MAEGTPKRVGKFTVAEEAPSSPSPVLGPESAAQEVQSSGASDSLDAFTLKSTQPRRRGRQPSKPTPVVQAVAEAPANYHLWAQLLIGSTNTVVVTWLGQECAMERREAEMLEPPIARILERLPTSQSQKMATFIDPMVILIAMGTWANRIIRVQRARRPGSITQEELERASGVIPNPPPVPQPVPQYQQPPVIEPEIPAREKIEVNPNGVPVAITNQMGEV